MTISEKVAHLKGLIEGMELEDSKNTKLIKAIADILEDLSYDLEDVQDSLAEVGEQVEMIDEDLENLENDYYDYDEDDDDCCCCGDDDCYEVECPACGEHLEFDFDEDKEEKDEE